VKRACDERAQRPKATAGSGRAKRDKRERSPAPCGLSRFSRSSFHSVLLRRSGSLSLPRHSLASLTLVSLRSFVTGSLRSVLLWVAIAPRSSLTLVARSSFASLALIVRSVLLRRSWGRYRSRSSLASLVRHRLVSLCAPSSLVTPPFGRRSSFLLGRYRSPHRSLRSLFGNVFFISCFQPNHSLLL
jgi:hypothetical protein